MATSLSIGGRLAGGTDSSFPLHVNLLPVWRATLDMIQDHWLVGVGAGVYPKVYPAYMIQGGPQNVMSYAHNLFLQVWAELGIVGLLVFVVLLLKVLSMSWRLAISGNPVYQGMFAALVGVLVRQQLDVPIWAIEVGGAPWLLVGVVAYAHETMLAGYETATPWWRKRRHV